MYTSQFLREVFNEKYQKNLLKEKRYDTNLDIKLDRIPIDNSSNNSIDNFYLNDKPLITSNYINTEKFMYNKSNIIHKAKRYVLKNELIKQNILKPREFTLVGTSTSNFYKVKNTMSVVEVEEKEFINRKCLPIKHKTIQNKLTPFQKNKQHCNKVKILLKDKQKKTISTNLFVNSKYIEESFNSSRHDTNFNHYKEKRINSANPAKKIKITDLTKLKLAPQSLLHSAIHEKSLAKIEPQINFLTSSSYFNKSKSNLKIPHFFQFEDPKNSIIGSNFNIPVKDSLSNLREYTNCPRNGKKIKMAIFEMDYNKKD